MEAPAQLDGMAKSIRSLTVAVWFLAAVNLALLVLVGVAYVLPSRLKNPAGDGAGAEASSSSFESWEGLPFEEKVKRSTVVLITENRREGGLIRAYIKEELKRKPGTVFQYGVGTEYPALSVVPKENTSYGDGSLVFLSGSPASNQSSVSIFGGYVPALENMSLERVRQVVAASK